eukprot:365778-Chlamydomonas_euryale.AAC.4
MARQSTDSTSPDRSHIGWHGLDGMGPYPRAWMVWAHAHGLGWNAPIPRGNTRSPTVARFVAVLNAATVRPPCRPLLPFHFIPHRSAIEARYERADID